ncbi:MAG: recombinase family protein [Proteobacteria bacterium]|nr:recombinase family protein [Pseudomonadota bacterium]
MTGYIVAYARTSTLDQVAGFEAQIAELKAAGAEKIFREQVSSVAERAELEALLDYIRQDDVVVVTKLDRLARSMRDLLAIVDRIEAKGAALRILSMNLDTATATGKLMLNVLGSVAEFERSMMLERQRVGIAKAKSDRKFKGRAPTVRKQSSEIEALLMKGLGPTDVAEKLGVARSSVYRVAKGALAAKREARQRLIAGDEQAGN